jgi:hypothetical protein
MPANLKLMRRGKVISRDEATEAPIVAVGSSLPDKSTGYVFDTDDEFQGWAREVGQEELVKRLDEATAKGQEQESRTDLAWLEAWHKKKTERITNDLNELAELYGLPITSPELFRKVTIEADPLIGSVFDPYILFDSNGCGGSWRPLTGPLPRFGWIDFNNRASSVNGLGGGILFSQYWFKAKRAYLFNIGNQLGDCLDLADIAFDNMASSAILV